MYVDGQCPKCAWPALTVEIVLDDQWIAHCSNCGFTESGIVPGFPAEAKEEEQPNGQG